MSKTVITIPNAPAPIGPYNQAILSNNTLFISGQIAIDPFSGELKTDDLREETQLVLQNLDAILKAAGMEKMDVVKASIFLSDMNHFQTVNEIYGEYFAPPYPARECVEVANLPKYVNVEISAIAVKS